MSPGCSIRWGGLVDFDEEHKEVMECRYLGISECFVY